MTLRHRLRVAIIGTGRISDLHAIEYLDNPKARDRRAVRPRHRHSPRAAPGPGGCTEARITDDYGTICSPIPTSTSSRSCCRITCTCNAALAAIAAGKAVSLQKPMCSRPGARPTTLVAAAERQGSRSRSSRTSSSIRRSMKAKALIDERRHRRAADHPHQVATPARARPPGRCPRSAEAWRQDKRQTGGGPLVFDDGHHKFALAWHFMGNPPKACMPSSARPASPDGFVFDAPAIISFRFPGNAHGQSRGRLFARTRDRSPATTPRTTGSRSPAPRASSGSTAATAGSATPPPRGALPRRRGAPPTTTWTPAGRRASSHSTAPSHRGAAQRHAAHADGASRAAKILRFALAAEESARIGRAVALEPESEP